AAISAPFAVSGPRSATKERYSSSSEEVNARMKTRSTTRTGTKKRKSRYWSAAVTRHSNALDLQPHVFKLTNPLRIALSLKRSAEHSRRRKATPYQSAMSMLNFYINRASSGLSQKQKTVLTRAKRELREVFHRND